VPLRVGIVGPPGSGKTTLFTALTGVRPEGYGTPHVGIAPIADERLEAVAAVEGSAKRTPATIELIDVPGTAEAQLGGVRRSDALLAVVRETPVDLQTVAVVGHNPSIGELSAVLDGGEGDPEARRAVDRGFPAGGVAVFGLPGSFAALAPGAATLSDFAVPGD